MRIRISGSYLSIAGKASILWLTVLVLAAGLLYSCGPTGSGIIHSVSRHDPLVWPQDNSDLSPDPDTFYGRLDNGLRFVIKENHSPRDRVSMHLFVQTGSLYEKPAEQGMAHFLEHMMFNGSVHFPPGEMVKYFQRIGMQFGPDANAHTGFKQTVYDIVLPQGDAKSLSEGLLVLRDYADGALLLPEEVERERKVVLAEMRSRDSVSFRTFKATLQFELPGLLIGERFPIGEARILEKMDDQMLRDFYRTWYRPERMILVLVGDLKTEMARNLIRERFSDLKSSAPEQSPPEIGTMRHHGTKTFYHHEVETGATQVSIETISQQTEPADTLSRRQKEMVVQLGNAIIQNRLDAAIQHPNAAITSAGIASGYYLGQIKYAQIEAQCRPESWRQALTAIEQELRSALTFGFTASELKRAKNDLRAQFQKAVQEERTRDSNALAGEIMADLNQWDVFQSPHQRAELLLPYLETITVQQVQKVLAEQWSADHRLILVTGNADLPPSSDGMTPEEQIQSVYRAATQTIVSASEDKKSSVFPYLPAPKHSGKIIHREHIDDLAMDRLEFENGFRVNLKQTNFKKDQVLATLSFGHGEASEPVDQPGLSRMTEAVVNESGYGAMDRIALEKALSGKLAQITFEIREDLFLVKGQSASSELPLLFQLLHTFVNDPGYRENARQLVLKRFEHEYESLPHSVDGMMHLKGQRFLAGGDTRFGAPELSQMQRRTLHQMQTWLEGQMRLDKMELAIVGDFDSRKAVELAAQYFGTLKKQAGQADEDMASSRTGPIFPRGKTLNLSVETTIPKTLVVVAYPTEDFWDIQRTRRLTMVAELFSERLREQIREKMGAAYSPYAFNRSYRAYKGFGMMQIHVLVDPNQAEAIVQEIKHIAYVLSTEKSGEDEFKRVLDPTMTYIKDLRQTNTYWLNSVLTGVGRHPQQLDWSRTIERDYAAITAEDIAGLARRYLVRENAAVIVLSPVKTSDPR